MFSKKILLSLSFALSVHVAWASSDFSCETTWSLKQAYYSPCSNIPTLSPSNDTRVNLQLLLVDNGFAALEAKPVTKEAAEAGYGKVPFTLETFQRYALATQGKADGSNNEGESSGFERTSRCNSSESGKADFIEAVVGSKELSKTEQKLLTEERQKLTPDCADAPVPAPPKKSNGPSKNAKRSPTYKLFKQYLTAAAAFYDGSYEEANATFSTLINSNQPWIKEASRYMLGRTQLNIAQQSAFDADGYPTREKTDQKALQASEEKFNDYLKEYPNGRYASSARGLLRRVYWMSGQSQKLADEYVWQLNNPNSPQLNVSLGALVQEADQKLLFGADPKQIKNPLLLATIDLSLMRNVEHTELKQISFPDLQKQQSLFAGHKALFDYVLAAHRFFVQKDAATVLKSLPGDIPQKMTYLDFSRLVLRGLALEATKDHLGARKLWMSLLEKSKEPLQAEMLQLALALNYEHTNEPELVFKANSPITEPDIRAIILRNDASADTLRQVIKSKKTPLQEHQTALYTLLYKDLLQGHYQSYVQDYRLLPPAAAKKTPSSDTNAGNKSQFELFAWSGKQAEDVYPNCPSTLDIAKILAKDAQDPFGLICLGDFVNANDLFSGYRSSAPSAPKTFDDYGAELGSAPSHFPGESFSRGEAYKAIIDSPNAPSDLKAYALYRSIKCYATSGSNHCGGEDVEKPVRKSWFQTLKKRYANTQWAKTLKYYW